MIHMTIRLAVTESIAPPAARTSHGRSRVSDRYEVHQVGGRTILEYRIPADALPELNANIVGPRGNR